MVGGGKGGGGDGRRKEEADVDAAPVHFEFGIRELVMNNAGAPRERVHSRPAGDRIRAGQTEVPGERGGLA